MTLAATNPLSLLAAAGFLGTRATLMLDVVVVALVVVLPTLAVSIWLARRGRYVLHKRLQLSLVGVLLVTVAAFEIDIRISGWQDAATPEGHAEPPPVVFAALYVHLVFAVTTVLLWGWVTWRAVRRFANPPTPGAHSRSHRFWGWAAAIDMVLTAVTGWFFYWLAFVQ